VDQTAYEYHQKKGLFPDLDMRNYERYVYPEINLTPRNWSSTGAAGPSSSSSSSTAEFLDPEYKPYPFPSSTGQRAMQDWLLGETPEEDKEWYRVHNARREELQRELDRQKLVASDYIKADAIGNDAGIEEGQDERVLDLQRQIAEEDRGREELETLVKDRMEKKKTDDYWKLPKTVPLGTLLSKEHTWAKEKGKLSDLVQREEQVASGIKPEHAIIVDEAGAILEDGPKHLKYGKTGFSKTSVSFVGHLDAGKGASSSTGGAKP